MRTRERGFSLLTAMVVVVVLTILVAAAITFTGKEVSSSLQHKQREAMASCAIAARNLVLSQLECGAQGRVKQVTSSIDTGDFLVRVGHLDDPDPMGPVEVSEMMCDSTQTGGGGMMDLTNTTIGAGGTGGLEQCYRVVTHCVDETSGARNEVEFMVRIAL